MIELTDEMRMVAYRDAREWAAVHGYQQPDDRMINDVLAAVLAIVERDYFVDRRYPLNCGAAGPDGLACQRSPGHGTNHAASDGNGLVQW